MGATLEKTMNTSSFSLKVDSTVALDSKAFPANSLKIEREGSDNYFLQLMMDSLRISSRVKVGSTSAM